jgi:hypothetical protein
VLETLVIIRQAFMEESISHTQMFEWKKARQVKSKVKSMLIIFFVILKEFVMEGLAVNSAHCCDILW